MYKLLLLSLLLVTHEVMACTGVESGELTELTDLTKTKIPSKGRVQDSDWEPVSPEIRFLLAKGKDSIDFLISRLNSELITDGAPTCPGQVVKERVIALIILSDLFLDETWTKSSLEILCWSDNFSYAKDVTQPDLSVLEIEYGKTEWFKLEVKWKSFWERYRNNVVWDKKNQYYYIKNEKLIICKKR